jgi:hypothetical protein
MLTMILQRDKKTKDGLFGKLTAGIISDFTCENLGDAIPAGSYKVIIDKSPRLGFETPHIKVPSRDSVAGGDAGIRIHPLNFPYESLGCIGVGDKEDADAIENSKSIFKQLMAFLKNQTDISIQIIDIPL